LAVLQREIGAVQWWSTIGRQPTISAAVPEEPFTPGEQSALEERFDALKEELLRDYVPKDEFEELRGYIEREFRDLKSFLKTMNKSSFRQTVFGYALTIGCTLASNPHVVRTVVGLFGEAIRHHTGGQPLLPEITPV
jgi:hypothetical protein